MERFSGKVKSIREYKGRLYEVIIDGVVPFEAEIVDINTDRLYKAGEYVTRDKIADRRPYAPMTIRIKKAKGQPTDRVTLKDTGDFYRSIYVKFERDRFTILASDVKTKKLMAKYGADIFGMNGEDMDKIMDKVYEYILEQFKKAVYAHL